MDCALSQRHTSTQNDEINDPIILFLEKIRSEYCNFKKEKEEIITALQKTNLNLTETINDLNDQLNSSYGCPLNTDTKRRKTNSDSDLDSLKLFGRINILDSASDKSLDSVFSKGASTDGSVKNIDHRSKKVYSSDSDIDRSKKIYSSDSDIDNAKFGCINITDTDTASDKSINSSLNDALNNGNILDDSEILFPQTQTEFKTPLKKPSSKVVLSPVNQNLIKKQNTTPVKNLPTPSLMKKLQLPKRMKSNFLNNENENPVKRNHEWISPNQIKQKTKNNWNMSFIQPVKAGDDDNLNKSGDIIACSQDVTLKSTKKDRNKTSLKHSVKLRQAKLEFDVKIDKKSELGSIKKEGGATSSEDVIVGSPACTNLADTKISRSLSRKISRKKTDDDLFVFPIKKSLSNESLTTLSKDTRPKTSSTSIITPTKQNKIKIEPKTAKKDDDVLLKNKFFEHMLTDDSIEGLVPITDSSGRENINDATNQIKRQPKISKKDDDVLLKSKFFEHMLTDDSIEGLVPINTDNSGQENKNNTAKKMLEDDSSLFMLPSQPDDVIIVEDTDLHDYNLSSMDLLAEMLRDDKDTQPLLRRFEAEQIKSLQATDSNNIKSISPPSTSRLQLPQNKNQSIDTNETKLSEIFDDKNDFTTTTIKSPEKKGFHHDCDDCQKFKKYLISQNVPLDEIERRLKTCKRPPKLHHTPEGFWDPCFREFPPGDPRNEVLIDYRFVNKKKGQK